LEVLVAPIVKKSRIVVGKRMGAGFMIPAGRLFGGSRSSLLVEKKFKIVETCHV